MAAGVPSSLMMESHSQVLSTSVLFLENVYSTLDLWEQILNHSMEQLSTLCLSPQTLRKNSNLKYQCFFFHSNDRMRVVETKLITYQMGLRHPHTASVYSLRIEDNPEMFSICCLIIARIMILLSYNSKLQCWNFYDSEENEIYKIKVSLSFFFLHIYRSGIVFDLLKNFKLLYIYWNLIYVQPV